MSSSRYAAWKRRLCFKIFWFYFQVIFPHPAASLNECNFDNGLCYGWRQSTLDDFDWALGPSSTPTSNPYPASGHGGSGKYMFIESSRHWETTKAKLELSAPGDGTSHCLTFYYLAGSGYPGKLNVYNGITKVFVASGLQSSLWLKEAKTVKLNSSATVTFEGIAGWAYDGDIAIDDVSITYGECQLCGASFRSKLSGWLNISQLDDDALTCNWTVGSVGIIQAVAIVWIEKQDSSALIKIFAGNGSEVFNRYGFARGTFLKIPFGMTDNIRIQTSTRNQFSEVAIQHVILKQDLNAAPLINGWAVQFSYHTKSTIGVNWRKLITELNHPVQHYIALIKDSNDTLLIAGKVLSNDTAATEFRRLKVFTKYVVDIFAVDDVGQPYRSLQLIVWTDEGVPGKVPAVTIHNVGFDSVNVTWSPIPWQRRYGILLGYTVFYQRSCQNNYGGRVNVSVTNTSLLLTNLLPGTEYGIEVVGFTRKGTGNFNIKRVSTSCEGERYFRARRGTFESPNYPCDIDADQACHLTTKLLPKNFTEAIWIMFNSFEVGSRSSQAICSTDNWVSVNSSHNSTRNTTLLMCGRTRHFALLVPSNRVDVVLNTRKYHPADGFFASYLALDKPFTAKHLPSWDIWVSGITSSSISVNWSPFPINTTIHKYLVNFKGDNDHGFLKFEGRYHAGSPGNTIIISWLKPYTFYKIQVLALTGSIENTTYSSEILFVRSGEEVPRRAPPNVSVTNLQATMVTVKWDPLPRQYASGLLLGYRVYFREKTRYHDPNVKTKVKTVHSNVSRVVLRDLKQGHQYEIQVATFNSKGEGPRSLQYTTTSCGVTFNQLFGRLSVVNNYQRQLNCFWRINAANISQAVALVFLKELRIGCFSGSFIKILTGSDTEALYLRNCLQQVPPLVEVSFGDARNITVQVYMDYLVYTHVKIEYGILKHGLQTGHSVAGWNITVVNTTATSVSIEWKNVSAAIKHRVGYYIVFVKNITGSMLTTEFLPENVSSARTDGLIPFTRYKVGVIGVDLLGQTYKSLEVTIMTGESVPSRAPDLPDSIYSKDGATNVTITWSPIPTPYHYGKLLGYRITYHCSCSHTHSGEVNASASNTSFVLEKLIPGTVYQVKVAGFTSKGTGKWGSGRIYTSCNGHRHLIARNGTVQSPFYRCNGLRNDCLFTISVFPRNTTRAIWIQFNAFYMSFWAAGSPTCRGDAKLSVITENKTRQKYDTVLCGTRRNLRFALLVPRDRVDLIFNSSRYYYRNEFNASYIALEKPVTVKMLPYWNVTVKNIKPYSISVAWTVLSSILPIRQYWVKYKQESQDVSLMFEAGLSRSLILSNFIKAYTVYEIQVLAMTGSILNDSYSSDTYYVTTEEAAPSKAPLNVHAINIRPKTVLVQWDPIPQNDANGRVLGYKAYYRDTRSGIYAPFNSANTSNPPALELVLTDLQRGKKYEIYLTAFTSKGEGPRSNKLEIITDCGITMNQSLGELKVAKEFETYVYCNWTIGNAGINEAVALVYLQSVYLRYCEEFIEIFDGKGRNMVNRRGCVSLAPGSFVEVPFYKASNITVHVLLTRTYRSVNIQFAILKNRLVSASPSAWNINAYNTSETSLIVDWSGLQESIWAKTSFFVLILNQTTPRNLLPLPPPTLRFLNSSERFASFTSLPIFSEYTARVYGVEYDGNTYKSDQVTVRTEESVPKQTPYIENMTTDLFERSITIHWSPVKPDDAQGNLLGYTVEYHALDQNFSQTFVTNEITTNIIMTNLKAGVKYQIKVAGFTRRGLGPSSSKYVTLCGGNLTEESGYFHYPYSSFDYNMHCKWHIRPQTNLSIIWITFTNFSFGKKDDQRQCRGAVKVSVPSSEHVGENEQLEMCGKKSTFSLVIESDFVEITAQGYRSFFAHYRAAAANVSTLTGEVLNLWKVHQSNASTSSFTISWSQPPKSFLTNTSVEKYLVLYRTNSTTLSFAKWVPSQVTNVTISDLEPFTNYTINVVVILTDSQTRGSTGWTSVQTAEGVPSGGPYIYKCYAVDYSKITIEWSKMYTGFLREVRILKGYRIYVTKSGDGESGTFRNITVGPNQLSLNITGLETDSSYRLWIVGFTSEGEGPHKECHLKTMCGGTVHNTSGQLQNPGFPRSLDYNTCLWRFHPPNVNGSVLFSFGHFELPSALSFCPYSYVSVSNQIGRGPERLCGRRTRFFILAQGGQVDFTFYEDRYSNYDSTFQASFFTSNESALNAPRLLDWTVAITGRSLTSVSVSWTPHKPQYPTTLQAYAVLCTPTVENTDPTIGYVNKSHTTLVVQNLLPITEYRVQVTALLVHPSNGALSMKGSRKIIVTTEEGVPSIGRAIHSYQFLTDSTIRIQWTEIAPEYIFGILRGYRILYYNGRTSKNITVGPNQLECNITGLQSHKDYWFEVSGFTSKGEGQPGTRLFVRARCVHDVYTTSGRIRGVAGRSDCIWRLHSPTNNGSIVLSFEHFSLPLSPQCSNVYVSVSDGNNSSPVRFCGLKKRFTVTRQGSQVDVRFYSKETRWIFWTGFTASYYMSNGATSSTAGPTSRTPNATQLPITTVHTEPIKTTSVPTDAPLTTAVKPTTAGLNTTTLPLTTAVGSNTTTANTTALPLTTDSTTTAGANTTAPLPKTTALPLTTGKTTNAEPNTTTSDATAFPVTTVLESNATTANTTALPLTTDKTTTAGSNTTTPWPNTTALPLTTGKTTTAAEPNTTTRATTTSNATAFPVTTAVGSNTTPPWPNTTARPLTTGKTATAAEPNTTTPTATAFPVTTVLESNATTANTTAPPSTTDKDATTPTTMALVPRSPSKEERQQSVMLRAEGLNISEWNQAMEEAFKITVANAASVHCASQKGACQSIPARSRRKRSTGNIVFTQDDVHVLPGYPKQISQDSLVASIAFYLLFPTGEAEGHVVSKNVLVSIAKSAQPEIGKSINSSIPSVQALFSESTSTPASPIVTTFNDPADEEKSKMNYSVIIGCVVGIVLVIVIAALLIWMYRKRFRCGKPRPGMQQSLVVAYEKEMDMVNAPSDDAHFNGSVKQEKEIQENESEVATIQHHGLISKQ